MQSWLMEVLWFWFNVNYGTMDEYGGDSSTSRARDQLRNVPQIQSIVGVKMHLCNKRKQIAVGILAPPLAGA